MKKLYELEQNWFTDGEYHDNTLGHHYLSWQEFLDEWGDADDGMNYVVNWSWEPKSESGEWSEDDHHRDGTLMILFIMQRKGFYNPQTIDVCKADEPLVREYLAKKFEYIKYKFSFIQEANQ